MLLCWDYTLIAIATSFHAVAILSTLFRLGYRWYTSRMWWDDAWAALAFLADIACLIVALLEQPNPSESLPRFFTVGNWIFSLAYPTLMWTARTSILTSMVRVSRPEGVLRHVALGTGIFFGLVGVGMLSMRIYLCNQPNACLMTRTALIIQTTTDCVADSILSALPVWFLRDMRLYRKRKVLILSVFSATMVINVVTVVETVMLFHYQLNSGSIIFEHVKLACAMIVCNLLVITAFVYRILHRNDTAIEHSTSNIEFTTINLAQVVLSQETSRHESSLSGMSKFST